VDVRRLVYVNMDDPDLGPMSWNEQLEWWEGSIRLTSDIPFILCVFARPRETNARAITQQSRHAIERVRSLERASREYAADQLLEIHNSEWAQGNPISGEEFSRRLVPDSLVIHETGYAEIHFRDGGLFWGHSVSVRIQADGNLQEAVVEG